MRKINVNEREDKYTCVRKDDKDYLIPPPPWNNPNKPTTTN